MHNPEPPEPQDLEGKLEELADKVDEVASTIKDLEEEKKDKHETMAGFHPLVSNLLRVSVVRWTYFINFAASWEISWFAMQTAPEGAQVVRARKYWYIAGGPIWRWTLADRQGAFFFPPFRISYDNRLYISLHFCGRLQSPALLSLTPCRICWSTPSVDSKKRSLAWSCLLLFSVSASSALSWWRVPLHINLDFKSMDYLVCSHIREFPTSCK